MLLHPCIPKPMGPGGGWAAGSRRGSHQPRLVMRRAEPKGKTFQLPIFPLNVVALPAVMVPLMIFEARYRVLFNTLLAGEEGVEEGLVQRDSPFCGSKKFGMCYVDNEGRLAAIGTRLEVVNFATAQTDGRLFVESKGQERFEIKSVVREKPVLLCEVELLTEDEDGSPEIVALAAEVAGLLRSTIKLNVKMNNISVSEEVTEPEELEELKPRDLSFYIASFFSDVKLLQQNLLEENSTLKRLQREKDILSETVRYYTAAAALKSAFPSGSASSMSSMESDLAALLRKDVKDIKEGASKDAKDTEESTDVAASSSTTTSAAAESKADSSKEDSREAVAEKIQDNSTNGNGSAGGSESSAEKGSGDASSEEKGKGGKEKE